MKESKQTGPEVRSGAKGNPKLAEDKPEKAAPGDYQKPQDRDYGGTRPPTGHPGSPKTGY